MSETYKYFRKIHKVSETFRERGRMNDKAVWYNVNIWGFWVKVIEKSSVQFLQLFIKSEIISIKAKMKQCFL